MNASIHPDAPHLVPGKKEGSEELMGYGYQWWLPIVERGDFLALGVSNQMIHVDPEIGLVIARHSASPDFQCNNFEPTQESMALWRTIPAELATTNAERQNRDLN